MSTSAAPAAAVPRGIDFSLPTCGETQCNSRGTCVPPAGGGTNLVCDCALGYTGQSCELTVNGALGVPLTIGVIVAILGCLFLAFIVAKIRRRQKKNRRRKLAMNQGYTVSL